MWNLLSTLLVAWAFLGLLSHRHIGLKAWLPGTAAVGAMYVNMPGPRPGGNKHFSLAPLLPA